MYQNLRYAATYSPQPGGSAVNDLDNVMWQAAYPPATVPAAPAVTLAAPAVETNGSDDGSLDIAIGAGRSDR